MLFEKKLKELERAVESLAFGDLDLPEWILISASTDSDSYWQDLFSRHGLEDHLSPDERAFVEKLNKRRQEVSFKVEVITPDKEADFVKKYRDYLQKVRAAYQAAKL